MFDQADRLRFEYPDMNLRIAQVGQWLLIGGSEESQKPFRETAMTFLVQDIETYVSYLPTTGASIVRDVRRVPSGRNMLVRYADGALVEYVEHDRPDLADDTLAARSGTRS